MGTLAAHSSPRSGWQVWAVEGSGGATVGSVRSLWGRAGPTAAAPGGRKTGGASPQPCNQQPQRREGPGAGTLMRWMWCPQTRLGCSVRERMGWRCPAGRAGGTAVGLGQEPGWLGASWSGPPRCRHARHDWSGPEGLPGAHHAHFIHPVATPPHSPSQVWRPPGRWLRPTVVGRPPCLPPPRLLPPPRPCCVALLSGGSRAPCASVPQLVGEGPGACPQTLVTRGPGLR